MSRDDAECLLCQASCTVKSIPQQDLEVVECLPCGTYSYSPLQVEAAGLPKRPHLVSWYIAKHNEETGRPYTWEDRLEGAWPENIREWSVPEKLNRVLLLVADRSEWLGHRVEIDNGTAWTLVQGRHGNELYRMLNYWEKAGAIKYHATPTGDTLHTLSELTVEGWQRVDELRPAHAGDDGRLAFIAMASGSHMDRLYELAIQPALIEAGWEPYRIEHDKFEGKICDQVIAKLQEASLVVVECSGSRPNVYYEAGFAAGRGTPVIWCLAENQKDEAAFDVRQYPHLLWSDEARLKQLLSDRLAALYRRDR